MQILRDENNFSMENLPLTVGEARKYLVQKLNGNHSKTSNHPEIFI
jgi:hypothetical protein